MTIGDGVFVEVLCNGYQNGLVSFLENVELFLKDNYMMEANDDELGGREDEFEVGSKSPADVTSSDGSESFADGDEQVSSG